MQRNQHRNNERHNSGYQDRTPFQGNQYAGGRRGGGSINMDNERVSSERYGQMNRGFDEYDRDSDGYDNPRDLHDSRNVSRQFAGDDYGNYGPHDNMGSGRRTFRGEHDDRQVIGDRYGYDDDARFGRSGHERQRFDHDRDDGRWGRDHASSRPGDSYETYDDQRRMTARDGGSRFGGSRGGQYGGTYGGPYGTANRDQDFHERGGQYYGGGGRDGGRDYRHSRTIGEPRYGSPYDTQPSDFNVSHDYGFGRNRSYGEENIRGMQGSDEWRGGSRFEDDHYDRPRSEQPDRRWLGNGYEEDRRFGRRR